jgi:hypothetical protein
MGKLESSALKVAGHGVYLTIAGVDTDLKAVTTPFLK